MSQELVALQGDHLNAQRFLDARETERMERATFAEFMRTWGIFSEARA